MKSIFERKPEWKLSEFVIEKTVRISNEDFERMLRHPMDGQPFITENTVRMYQDDGDVYHCILVTGKERTDGILVESEEYGYARYASYVPEISTLVYPTLAKWNWKLLSAVDFIVETGIHQAQENSWQLSYEELEKQTGLALKGQHNLQEMLLDILLNDREEVVKLQADDESMCIMFHPDFGLGVTENAPEKRNVLHKEQQCNLKEMLLKGVPLNTYLIHPQDVGFIPVGRFIPSDLTSNTIQRWRDILEARVILIKEGAYGLEIELAGVPAERLREFDEFLTKIPLQSSELEMKF